MFNKLNHTSQKVLHANADCPRYDQLRNESRKTSEYLVLEASNKDFLNLMMNYSRLKLNYYTMWQIADKALVEVTCTVSFLKLFTER